jgi:predicted nucleic acid-binding protein
MTSLFIDSNIVLDLLAKRDAFYNEAALLFSLADKGKLKLAVSSLTFATTYYILSRQLSNQETRNVLRKLEMLVKVLSLDAKIIKLALNDNLFSDFENAVQYFTALENKQEAIITRNLKDFRNSTIPVFTASDYLSGRNEKKVKK